MHEELVLGTTNAGKVRELAALLEPHGIRVISLRECQGAVSVEETGTTFAANADLKASQQASALSRWVLAEDSGLCVDALGGAPGIHSARFSTGGDDANNSLLLERLKALLCPAVTEASGTTRCSSCRNTIAASENLPPK
jgi:XTP/dITP diphosphohydrolase